MDLVTVQESSENIQLCTCCGRVYRAKPEDESMTCPTCQRLIDLGIDPRSN